MAVYATYFDSRYLVRGVACLRSLLAHAREPVQLYVLALDDGCARLLPDLLGELPEGTTLRIERLSDFEKRHPELAPARADRSLTEYIFTLTPFLCRDATLSASPGDWCVYIDADTFFFDDPALALRGSEAADILLTEHRFPDAKAHQAASYGRFNIGWLAFRNAPRAYACLDDWAELCLRSCALLPSGETYGDQKYLDEWPARFPGIVVVGHPGLNAGPWNAARHSFAGSEGHVTVDGSPLLLFHFHRFARWSEGLYETDYRDYGALSRALRELVYPPYIAMLEHVWSRYRAQLADVSVQDCRRPHPGTLPYRVIGRLTGAVRLFMRRRIVFRNGRALSPIEGLYYV